MNNELRIYDLLDQGVSPEMISELLHVHVRYVLDRHYDHVQDANDYADADAEAYGDVE